jgi:hypothetical protein
MSANLSLASHSVSLPFLARILLLAMVAWPLLGGLAKHRGADLRLFSLFPLILGFTAGSVCVVHVVEGTSFTGKAPHATAAGLAESLFVPITGAILSACIAGAVAVFPLFREARRHRSAAAAGIFVLFLVAAALHAAVVYRVQANPIYTPELLRFSFVALALNAGAALSALVFAFVRQPRLSEGSGRAWFFALAGGSVLVTIFLIDLMDRFSLFAIQG